MGIGNIFFWQVTLRILRYGDVFLGYMQNIIAPKLETFIEDQWLRVFPLPKYHLIAQSV